MHKRRHDSHLKYKFGLMQFLLHLLFQSDEFYRQSKFKNYGEIGELLRQLVAEYQTEVQEFVLDDLAILINVLIYVILIMYNVHV